MTSSTTDGPPCFPLMDLFRRLASAGSLVVQQEKGRMVALVEPKTKQIGERLSNLGKPLNSKPQEMPDEGEIVFIVEDDVELSGKGDEHTDEAVEAEVLDTNGIYSSPTSESPPSSQTPLEVSSELPPEASSEQSQEAQVTEPTPTIQKQEKPEEKQQAQKKKQVILKIPPIARKIFGLDVVMESGLEDLEDEVTERNDDDDDDVDDDGKEAAAESSSGNRRASCIRWSEKSDDPDALNVTVHEVECIKDRTDMWWQGSEFDTMKKSVTEAIRFCKSYNRNHVELLEDIMRCDCLEDEDLMKDLLKDLLSTSDSASESFLRGLEGHLSKLISKHRMRHSKKVLSVQKGLKDSRTLEETWELLREESLDKSQLLSAFARRMGQFDEMVVAKAQKKPRASLWGV
ncbi:unnamed protein product [Cylindrotheca closterium]|uniref:Uncharacterized protein n=1 Tax=Cylindrotheca closterium TaxID=2856 RepID=A0AAD2JKN4_9STRA|nr:unnamed protein product [Cylindrotheca closterium]